MFTEVIFRFEVLPIPFINSMEKDSNLQLSVTFGEKTSPCVKKGIAVAFSLRLHIVPQLTDIN